MKFNVAIEERVSGHPTSRYGIDLTYDPPRYNEDPFLKAALWGTFGTGGESRLREITGPTPRGARYFEYDDIDGIERVIRVWRTG